MIYDFRWHSNYIAIKGNGANWGNKTWSNWEIVGAESIKGIKTTAWINNNKSNDVITPATVYDYLKMPQTNPEKNSWINYYLQH